MKMLLASNDLLALQPVAKRLLDWGIPIELSKPEETSACLEIWVQRDTDFSWARKLLRTEALLAAFTTSPAEQPC